MSIRWNLAKGILFSTLSALAVGYCSYWLPYYSKIFSDNIKIVGYLPDYKLACEAKPANPKIICTDEWHIPVKDLSSFGSNTSIDFGSLLYTTQYGCFDRGQFEEKFSYGDISRTSLDHFLLHTHQIFPISAFSCTEYIAIRSWGEGKFLRHGYNGGLITIGFPERIDQLKRLIEIVGIYFHQILVLVAFLALVLFSSIQQIIKSEKNTDPFLETLPLWVLTFLLNGSGIIPTLVPIESTFQLQRRIGNFLSLLSATTIFIKVILPNNKVTRAALTPLIKPFHNYDVLNLFFSKLSFFIILIIATDQYAYFFIYVQVVTSVAGVAFCIWNKNSFALYFMFHLAAILRILNIEYTPQSNCSFIFVSVYTAFATLDAFQSQGKKAVLDLVNTLTKDRTQVEKLAHDFRSPIAILKMLTTQIDSAPNKSEIQYAVKNTLDHMSQLAKSIQIVEPTKLNNPTAVILSKAKALKSAYSEIIQILKIDSPSDISIACEPSTFSRIIDNILKNAYEAPGVSTITIQTNTEDSSHFNLVIQNDGPSIPNEILEKIVSKGFSYGKKLGSGIGVKFCLNELQKRNGSFSITNKESITTVMIRVPISN